MSEIAKIQKCLVVKGGLQIWLDEERADRVEQALQTHSGAGFLPIDGRLININEVSGIYTPADLEEMTRRKNGEWQCKKGKWHERNEKCECNRVREDGAVWMDGVGWIK